MNVVNLVDKKLAKVLKIELDFSIFGDNKELIKREIRKIKEQLEAIIKNFKISRDEFLRCFLTQLKEDTEKEWRFLIDSQEDNRLVVFCDETDEGYEIPVSLSDNCVSFNSLNLNKILDNPLSNVLETTFYILVSNYANEIKIELIEYLKSDVLKLINWYESRKSEKDNQAEVMMEIARIERDKLEHFDPNGRIRAFRKENNQIDLEISRCLDEQVPDITYKVNLDLRSMLDLNENDKWEFGVTLYLCSDWSDREHVYIEWGPPEEVVKLLEFFEKYINGAVISVKRPKSLIDGIEKNQMNYLSRKEIRVIREGEVAYDYSFEEFEDKVLNPFKEMLEIVNNMKIDYRSIVHKAFNNIIEDCDIDYDSEDIEIEDVSSSKECLNNMIEAIKKKILEIRDFCDYINKFKSWLSGEIAFLQNEYHKLFSGIIKISGIKINRDIWDNIEHLLTPEEERILTIINTSDGLLMQIENSNYVNLMSDSEKMELAQGIGAKLKIARNIATTINEFIEIGHFPKEELHYYHDWSGMPWGSPQSNSFVESFVRREDIIPIIRDDEKKLDLFLEYVRFFSEIRDLTDEEEIKKVHLSPSSFLRENSIRCCLPTRVGKDVSIFRTGYVYGHSRYGYGIRKIEREIHEITSECRPEDPIPEYEKMIEQEYNNFFKAIVAIEKVPYFEKLAADLKSDITSINKLLSSLHIAHVTLDNSIISKKKLLQKKIN